MKLLREFKKANKMRPVHKHPERTVISFLPLSNTANRFIGMFSQALSDQGYVVQRFSWRLICFRRSDFVFLHWPNEFFQSKGIGVYKSLAKLAVMQLAIRLWGTKFIWVAHNAAPHDAASSSLFVRRCFLNLLRGIVYLSEYSRGLITRLYPEIAGCRALVTVHGHYRDSAATPASPSTTPGNDLKLVHFGRIRPYKNVEALVEVVSCFPSGFELVVAGVATHKSICASIHETSLTAPHIKLDLRDEPLGEAELEALIDSADAVVLPYKNILNSGAALLALSRNRPVLAPNVGSLPELREAVGPNWIYLYDGEFNKDVLVKFRGWVLTSAREPSAPLGAFGESRLRADLAGFVESLNARENALHGSQALPCAVVRTDKTI